MWLRLVLALVLALVAGCKSGFKAVADLAGTDAPADALAADGSRGDGEPRREARTTKECATAAAVRSEDVDGAKEPGRYTSIAIDAAGDPHISHYAQGAVPDPFGNGGYHDARYSVRRGGKWINEEIYTPGVVGGFSALGLSAGQVHVVFYDWAQKKLLWAWRDASSWKSPKVIAGDGNVGWGNDLAVDASGTLHVVTFAGSMGTSPGKVLYLRRVGVDWQQPVVLEASAGDQGPKGGIAIGADEKVHVSLCDGAGQLKLLAGKDGSFGAAQIVDAGLGTSCASDLAVDGAGDVHACYHDGVKKVLKHVGQAGGVLAQPLVLDSSGVVGSYCAIAAEKGGDLWVAYYDHTHVDLRLIRRRGGSWGQPDTIDSAGNVGRHVSAALGREGELHVAHWNETAAALRHTRVCP